jgi:hypothetical protein
MQFAMESLGGIRRCSLLAPLVKSLQLEPPKYFDPAHLRTCRPKDITASIKRQRSIGLGGMRVA